MSRRTLIALLLMTIGFVVAGYGIGGAVLQLVGLYQGALTDPLGQPDNAEKAASAAMLRSVMVGLCGIPPLVVGSVLLKIAMFKRWRQKMSGVSGGPAR